MQRCQLVAAGLDKNNLCSHIGCVIRDFPAASDPLQAMAVVLPSPFDGAGKLTFGGGGGRQGSPFAASQQRGRGWRQGPPFLRSPPVNRRKGRHDGGWASQARRYVVCSCGGWAWEARADLVRSGCNRCGAAFPGGAAQPKAAGSWPRLPGKAVQPHPRLLI